MKSLKGYLRQNYSPIGIEIDCEYIRMLQVKRKDGLWRIHRAAQESLQPQEGEEDDTVRRLAAVIKRMIRTYSFHGHQVVSALPNQKVDILPVQMSVADDNGLEEKILENARARLSYGVEQAVIDYLPLGTHRKSGAGKKAFWIIASQRSHIDEHLAIIKGAGLHSRAIDIKPCALIRSLVTSGYEVEEHLLLIHLGEKDTLFLLMDKTGPLAMRVGIRGYLYMAEKLQKALEIDSISACSLLSDYGFHDYAADGGRGDNAPSDNTESVIQKIIFPIFEEILGGLENFLNYCHAEIKEMSIEKICISGKAYMIRNFDREIEKKLGMTAELFNPFTLSGKDRAVHPGIDVSHGSIYSVPFGLTMRES